MKTIQLTHGQQRMELSENEAVSLHRALSEALDKAGIDAQRHATVAAPNGVRSFTRDAGDTPTLTDC